MHTKIDPLVHTNAGQKSDKELTKEGQEYLSQNPPLQVLAEILGTLRELKLPWWSSAHLHQVFPAAVRMGWLAQRPDIRQHVTTTLTGLLENSARRKDPQTQATLIEDAIADNDRTLDQFEEAFDPRALVVYGDAAAIWQQFRDRLPWDKNDSVHHKLVADLIEQLLTERSSLTGGFTRKPILTHLQVRVSIDEEVWENSMPAGIRIRINRARLEQEGVDPTIPYLAKDELRDATPEIIASSIKHEHLKPIFLAAEAEMGFAPPAKPSTAPPPASQPDRIGSHLPEAPAAAGAPRGDDADWDDKKPTGVPPALRPSEVPEALEINVDDDELLGLIEGDPNLDPSPNPPEDEATRVRSLESRHPDAIRVEGVGLLSAPPPPLPDGSRGGSRVEIQKKIELEPRFTALSITIDNMDRFTVRNLEVLLALFEAKAWDPNEEELKAALIAFCEDTNANEYVREDLERAPLFPAIRFKFLKAMKTRNADLARALSESHPKTEKKSRGGPAWP